MNWDQPSSAHWHRLQNQKLRRYLTDIVAPFSPYYKKLFAEHRIDPRNIQTVADLRHLPFTTKSDLLATDEHPEKFLEFILQPDPQRLQKRPAIILEALLRGPTAVRNRLEKEFRPIFL